MARTRDIVVGLVIVGIILISLMIIFVSLMGINRSRDFTMLPGGKKVALIEVTGVIESSEDIIRQLRKYDEDNSVMAIVLRIDSPGGGVAPSQEIYDYIKKVRDNGTYVVVSMGSVAASGGYYIACAADTIVANKGTLTGSIGVIFSFMVYEGLMDKVGVQLEVIKAGELKDVGNYSREMTQKEREMLQAALDDVHGQFILAVSEGRNMDIAQVEELADGSVFTGNQALNLGLVDKLGGLEDAISLAGEMSGLGDNPRVVREYPRRRTIFDLLGESFEGLLHVETAATAGPKLEYIYK
jgi:protease IV